MGWGDVRFEGEEVDFTRCLRSPAGRLLSGGDLCLWRMTISRTRSGHVGRIRISQVSVLAGRFESFILRLEKTWMSPPFSQARPRVHRSSRNPTSDCALFSRAIYQAAALRNLQTDEGLLKRGLTYDVVMRWQWAKAVCGCKVYESQRYCKARCRRKDARSIEHITLMLSFRFANVAQTASISTAELVQHLETSTCSIHRRHHTTQHSHRKVLRDLTNIYRALVHRRPHLAICDANPLRWTRVPTKLLKHSHGLAWHTTLSCQPSARFDDSCTPQLSYHNRSGAGPPAALTHMCQYWYLRMIVVISPIVESLRDDLSAFNKCTTRGPAFNSSFG